MNQDQRKYLLSVVDSTHREQVEALERKKPKKPSLNNYLVAAFLDNTIKMKDPKGLKDKIREMVLKMGQGDVLIGEDDDDDSWSYRRRNRSQREKQHFVKLIAEDIFEIPESYTKAYEEYRKELDSIEEKITQLNAQAKTITMKIQIGSTASLANLIAQVDNMADLNIINSHLILGAADDQKLIENKKQKGK